MVIVGHTCFVLDSLSCSPSHLSLQAKGELVPVTWETDTVCDGLLTSLGELTFPVLRDHLEAVLTVPDEATMRAMRLLFERVIYYMCMYVKVPVSHSSHSPIRRRNW